MKRHTTFGDVVPTFRGEALRIGGRVAVLVILLFAGTALAQTNPITKGSLSVQLQPFVTVPSTYGAPQDFVSANDGTGRMFVATRNGDVLAVSASGSLSATPFLNMASAGINIYTDGEGGFPGLAFSPNFNAPAGVPGSGKFYTWTTEPYSSSGPAADFSHPELAPSTGTAPSNQIVIREWSVSTDPNAASTTSRVLMRINHPQSNHQGGGLKFGADGDLYISLGDGGGGNDYNGSPTSNTDGHTNGTGNAQDTSVVFGKILRIDPKGNNSANGQYGIPSDNPFASSNTAVKEIYAYGLRNPYRISVDRLTGKIYAGDVGQSAREEVDVITKGGNYGWVYMEGTRNNASDAGRTAPGGFTSIAPIGEYTHNDGISIMGGFVYRGALLPDLAGKYIFGDYAGTAGKGRIFYMDPAGGPISEFNYSTAGGAIAPPSGLYGFGENAQGELYALFDNGQILAFVPEPGVAALALTSLPLLFLKRKRRLTT